METKKLLFAAMLLSCMAFLSCTRASVTEESPEAFNKRMEWWRDARFGMFIHWGAYAVPAGIHNGEEIPGIGEWIMDRAKIPVEEYEKYPRQFNPVEYDPYEWVRIARNAGMKYIIITSKHHDGFCLWDSDVTEYDMVDFSPYGKDLLKPLAEACEKEGIRLGFYHSIMDWHHPDASGENFPAYREKYLKPQLKELIKGYGDVAVLWFDGEWIEEWTEEQGKDLYSFVRNLKPDIIINNRVGKGRMGMQGMNKGEGYAGDFGTPEQEILDTKSDLDWETCMTMNDTWGFKKNDHNWKSTRTLIHQLVDAAAKGGNYLLNVGPAAEGIIPAPSVDRLREMGEWVKVNGEAIYETRASSVYREGENIRFTRSKDGKIIYAIFLEWPGTNARIESIVPVKGSEIRLFGSPDPLAWEFSGEGALVVNLPEAWQDEENRPVKHAWVLRVSSEQ